MMELLPRADRMDEALNRLKFINQFLQEHDSKEWCIHSSTICHLLGSSIALMETGDDDEY